ncbi:hypothetical protein BJX66DRAFT_343199 [Aspergillus keveii]|uniref:BTB domain-containing protein n=1 Tax=Aspergillus keveii TaxID=714993 RepID=A0ABR4FPV9_9EURO
MHFEARRELREKVAAIEGSKSQGSESLEVTLLTQRGSSCSMMSLKDAASGLYWAVACFYGTDTQQPDLLEIKPLETFGCMLDYFREIKISSEVVEAAAWAANLAANRYAGPELVSVLLDHRLEEVEITEDVTKAATVGYRCEEILSILLDGRHGPRLPMDVWHNWRL